MAVFNALNMKRIKNAITAWIPKAISLSVRSIANESAGNGTIENLRVVGRNEREGTTANLPEVRERRFSSVP